MPPLRALSLQAGAWLLLAVVAAACGGDSAKKAAPTATVATSAGGSTGCSESATRPRDPGTFVADRVYFTGYLTPGWRQGDKLQTARESRTELFAKVGLGLRANEPVLLRVPRRALGRVTLTGWGPRRSRLLTVRQQVTGPCAADTWSIRPGGFIFTRRQCLLLEVTAAGRTSRVPFGLGRACPRR